LVLVLSCIDAAIFKGLTTAATLWVTAAIGLAVGVGMVLMSVATTLLVFLLVRFGPRSGLLHSQIDDKTSHKEKIE